MTYNKLSQHLMKPKFISIFALIAIYQQGIFIILISNLQRQETYGSYLICLHL